MSILDIIPIVYSPFVAILAFLAAHYANYRVLLAPRAAEHIAPILATFREYHAPI
jgi:hypothetical protein